MDSRTIGYVASALVLAAFGMKDMVNLRIVAICSNVAFITYAVMLNLPPILILHVTLLPLNGWRLAQEVQRRMIQQSSRTYVSDQRQQITAFASERGRVAPRETDSIDRVI
jgi:hypothetical protein